METLVSFYFLVWLSVKYSFHGERLWPLDLLKNRQVNCVLFASRPFLLLRELYCHAQLKMWAASYSLWNSGKKEFSLTLPLPVCAPQQLSRALPQCPVTTLTMTRYFTVSFSKCKRFLKTTARYFRESNTKQEKQKYAWHHHMEVINANLYCKFRAGVVRRDFPCCVHCCHLTCWVLSIKLDLKDDGKFLNPTTNTHLNAA